MLDTTAQSASSDSASPAEHTASADSRSWKAWLDLEFEKGRDKTLLRRRHFGPLVIQRPFYPEGQVCHTYLLHPPGGVVGGDRLSVKVNCRDGASGLLTTPGANRFYGSDGRRAHQVQTVSVADACFEWLPAETIYFNNANVSQNLRIELSGASRFIGWDIVCFGRPAGNHGFSCGQVVNRLEVYLNKVPVLVDRLQVTGSDDIKQLSGMRGNTVYGTLLLWAPSVINEDLLATVRDVLESHECFAATMPGGMITVRYLGQSAESARNGFIDVWRALRPTIMRGRTAVAPRIWAT